MVGTGGHDDPLACPCAAVATPRPWGQALPDEELPHVVLPSPCRDPVISTDTVRHENGRPERQPSVLAAFRAFFQLCERSPTWTNAPIWGSYAVDCRGLIGLPG
jgi:hypothetical protein